MFDYLTLKTIHIVGLVSWFSGLFYFVRLLVYHVEAHARPEAERQILTAQLAVMERRLWFGIAWPAMLVTLVFGVWLMVLYRQGFGPWLWWKLGFVGLLLAYHLTCGHLRHVVVAPSRWTSQRLRAWNEVATLLLVIIVALAVKKDSLGALGMLLWLAGAGLALFLGLRVYDRTKGPRAS